MISQYFIDRPIFATVIAILIILGGLVAMKNLPIEQYPNITPPQIQVQTVYLGASADTVSTTVASPLETQINGVENMIYMTSQNSASGEMILSVFFDIGTDINQANIDVQNKVSLALASLPFEVQRVGLTVKKQSPTFLMLVAIQSPDARYDEVFISNYTSINIVDELKRTQGVSDVSVVGARDYSMRIWLKPDRMAQLGLIPSDIIAAIQGQNQQFAVGMIGKAPNNGPIQLTVPIATKGRLDEPSEFENIIIRANPDGSMIRLKDVGRAELGAYDYSIIGAFDNNPTTLVAVYQQYGANALDTAQNIRNKLSDMSAGFPEGITYMIPYDTTKFVRISIEEVVKTLIEAAFLVALVMLIFLQSPRVTLIPLVAMVVSIIGALAGMYLLGFSINTLTLFGLVLAVGIVVDDAIVVTENVERNMREKNSSPRDAAIEAMKEVTAPVIAIMFVLVAVFVPVAFLGGITGQLYKQFAVTIAVSVTISGFAALILSPALAASLLKPNRKEGRFGLWFNAKFHRLSEIYIHYLRVFIDYKWVSLLFGTAIVALLGLLMYSIPTSFVPEEDQGYFIVQANLPDSSSLVRTSEVTTQIWNITKQEPLVEQMVSLTGFSLLDSLARNSVGSHFVVLKDWDLRTRRGQDIWSIIRKLSKQYSTISEANIFTFNAPAIQGLGAVGGFEIWIENRGGGGIEALENALNQYLEAARKRPELTNLTSTFSANALKLYVDLDREKATSLQVPIESVFDTLQTLLGSVYVNDFNKFGRVFKVVVQAEPSARQTINDIGDIYVRSTQGKMIPLKSLVTIKYERGPELISRFNNFIAVKINGSAAHGYSSGEAMNVLEELAREVLPPTMHTSWSGLSFQEKTSGGSSFAIFGASLILVFLILAALYERWSSPFVIILAVPFGVFGSFLALWLTGRTNDVYFQIGLITLIALAAKNAILIVEFAQIKRDEGKGVLEATLEASALRLRAIIMTSLTAIIGIMPLALSSGAGAQSRQSVAMGMIGGMTAATFLAIFFVPLFFVMIESFLEKRREKNAPQ